MNEYYGVTRTKSYLSHDGSPQVYKNHKYIARAKMSNGLYRYFYDSAELAAYKGSGGNSNQTTTPAQQATKVTRGKHQPTFGNSHLSSGALNYRGESTPFPTQPNSTIVNTIGSKKKKKSKSKKSSVTKVIQSIVRR